jgi:hypothetical protein
MRYPRLVMQDPADQQRPQQGTPPSESMSNDGTTKLNGTPYGEGFDLQASAAKNPVTSSAKMSHDEDSAGEALDVPDAMSSNAIDTDDDSSNTAKDDSPSANLVEEKNTGSQTTVPTSSD